jgi:hypothetical protein
MKRIILALLLIASPALAQQPVTSVAGNISAAAGITPTVSTSAESSHVLKASGGNVYGVYATNLTATAGFLLLFNAATVPADGAVTPAGCVPLAASSYISINYNPGPPGYFNTGIVAVLSSGATCFTKTTGTITGFISGSVQ